MDKANIGTEREQQLPYARAREAGSLSRETLLGLALATPGELKQLNSRIRSLTNRRRWRSLTQRRCALVAITLRACERVLGSAYAGRERGEDRGWTLFVRDEQGARVAVIAISSSLPKRFDDFEQPLELTVLEPARFNVEAFEAWRRDDLSHRRRRRTSRSTTTR